MDLWASKGDKITKTIYQKQRLTYSSKQLHEIFETRTSKSNSHKNTSNSRTNSTQPLFITYKVGSIYVPIYSHKHASIETFESQPCCSYNQICNRLCQYIECAFEIRL